MSAAEPIDLAPPPEAALAVLDRLQAAGYEAYCVGGCVRDRLIGRGVGDWDLTTNALPEQVVALFDHVIPTGMAHGTVTVVSAGLNIEVTTYRVDLGYTDGRRPDGVAFTRSLAEDLARRDFTMNAMAWDPRRGLLVDLYAGRADLAAGCVRAVGEPEARFREDGLRALRAVRFASVLGLDISPATWDAIGRTLDVFARVSAERIQVELVKTLMSPRPGWGALRLAESGLLGVFLPAWPTSCMPAVADALGRAAPDLAIRLAVFLSPLVDGAEAALDALRPDHAVDAPAVRALAAAIGRGGLDAALGFHAALQTPTWAGFDARLEAASARMCPLVPKELALGGNEVMAALKLPPSRIVGRLMDALLRRVWADPTLNTREGLAGVLPSVYAEVSDAGGAT